MAEPGSQFVADCSELWPRLRVACSESSYCLRSARSGPTDAAIAACVSPAWYVANSACAEVHQRSNPALDSLAARRSSSVVAARTAASKSRRDEGLIRPDGYLA